MTGLATAFAKGFAASVRPEVDAELERLGAAGEEARRIAAEVARLSAEVVIRRMAGLPSQIMEQALIGAKDSLVSAAGEAALGAVQRVVVAAIRGAAKVVVGVML